MSKNQIYNSMVVGVGLCMLCCAQALICPQLASAQNGSDGTESVITGSLSEIRNKRRLLLVVKRVPLVDARGPEITVLTEAFQSEPTPRHRLPRLYNNMARRLNKYMVKYQSISAARNIAEAEFIVFFNLIEYRRPLGYPYPFGELYVISNDRSGGRQPRILWRTRKSPTWADDAINELINELKNIKGEG